MIARGWLSRAEVEVRLLAAATVNGLVAEDGLLSVRERVHFSWWVEAWEGINDWRRSSPVQIDAEEQTSRRRDGD